MLRRPACSHARRWPHLPRSSSAALGAAQQHVGQWITVANSTELFRNMGRYLAISYRQEGPLTVLRHIRKRAAGSVLMSEQFSGIRKDVASAPLQGSALKKGRGAVAVDSSIVSIASIAYCSDARHAPSKSVPPPSKSCPARFELFLPRFELFFPGLNSFFLGLNSFSPGLNSFSPARTLFSPA